MSCHMQGMHGFVRPALLLGLTATVACAPILQYPAKSAAPPPIHELWQEPRDLAARDLFYGAGGRQMAPDPRARYEFEQEDTTGASRGYEVRDDRDMEWDVKLGPEAQPEIVASRLLWAIGYHQPATYYVPAGWRLTGAPGWQKDTWMAGPIARFRPKPSSRDVVGEWSWYENPFVGTRAFNGLVLANLILANWDYKASNNRIYEVKPPVGEASRLFVVQDLGASLGRETPNPLHWIRWRAFRGTKGNVEDFEETGFVRRVRDGRVELAYDGMDPGLFDGVTPDDVRWVCGLFARLRDEQWNDAFRAAGYDDATRDRYVRKIKEKIAQGMAL